MVSLKDYLDDPCGTASLPYWKCLRTAVPENMKIVHKRDMEAGLYAGYADEPYFRLRHDLRAVEARPVRGAEIVPGEGAVREFVRLINESYADLRVTETRSRAGAARPSTARTCGSC